MQDNMDKARIDFARSVFTNVQELIRFMDQKSGLALVIVGLLSAAAFAVLNLYLNGNKQIGVLKQLTSITGIHIFNGSTSENFNGGSIKIYGLRVDS